MNRLHILLAGIHVLELRFNRMNWITRNKSFGTPKKPTLFRRLALGSWNEPSDPTIYGVLEVNVEKALKLIEKLAAESGERITITHFSGKVLAEVLKKVPELNSELRFGKFYPRSSIDVSFQVAIESSSPHEKAHDLSTGLVTNVGEKSITDVARELNASARGIRGNRDPAAGIKNISAFVPGPLLLLAVRALRSCLNTFNLWSPALGVPRNAFGSILITNVGSLGIDFALPALFPPANVGSIIAVGAIFLGPVYETDDQGVVTKTKLERFVRLCGAFDHRYVDGLHASRFAREIRRLFDHPDVLL